MERGWCARVEHRYDEAYRDIAKAIELFREARDHNNLVDALGRLGHVEMDRARWDEARAMFEEGIGICRNANDPCGTAHKLQHLGDVHHHAGRKAEALACYHEAMSLYRSQAEPPKLRYANTLLRVAVAEAEAGRADQAKPIFVEARELYRAVGVQEGVDDCSNRIDNLSR